MTKIRTAKMRVSLPFNIQDISRAVGMGMTALQDSIRDMITDTDMEFYPEIGSNLVSRVDLLRRAALRTYQEALVGVKAARESILHITRANLEITI